MKCVDKMSDAMIIDLDSVMNLVPGSIGIACETVVVLSRIATVIPELSNSLQ